MPNHKCIYCKEEKDESEFNREHVVPRSMGTYKNGLVLNNNEVCRDCNTYFDRNFENRISLNSLESFLRIKHGRPMSDGRRVRTDRLSFSGVEGIFNGLDFIPVVDSSNEEKLHFEITPRIGILSSNDDREYDYYKIEDLPDATDEVKDYLKDKERPIITVGIPQEDATRALLSKGYLDSQYDYSNLSINDLFSEDYFTTRINVTIDSIIRRLCAKTIFNYLCYCNGKEYVLSEEFDIIRKYIRYGEWSDELWFRYSKGPLSVVAMPNDTAHVVGYLHYTDGATWKLCGCVTWFGELTYVINLGDTKQPYSFFNMLSSTKMATFDNEDRNVSEDEGVYIFSIRKD